MTERKKVLGVGRMADNPNAVMVMLDSAPTDDDLRTLHTRLNGWLSGSQPPFEVSIHEFGPPHPDAKVTFIKRDTEPK